jgi:hypothetical protein
MKVYWGVEVYLHAFFDLGTGWRWVVSFTPRPFYPQGKSPWYPLDRRLGGPQSRFGRGVHKQEWKGCFTSVYVLSKSVLVYHISIDVPLFQILISGCKFNYTTYTLHDVRNCPRISLILTISENIWSNEICTLVVYDEPFLKNLWYLI